MKYCLQIIEKKHGIHFTLKNFTTPFRQLGQPENVDTCPTEALKTTPYILPFVHDVPRDRSVTPQLHPVQQIPHGQKLPLQSRQIRFCTLMSEWIIKYLLVGKALFSEDLEQRGSIAVSSLKHLPDDGQEVPDALWLSAPQGAQQTCPFSSCRWLSGRQVHGVHITCKKI